MRLKLMSGVLLILLISGAYWGLNTSKQTKSGEGKSTRNLQEVASKENNKGLTGVAETASETASETVDKPSVPPAQESEKVPVESEFPILIDDQEGFQVSVKWEKQLGASIQKFSVSLGNHVLDISNFDFQSNTKVLINNKEIPITLEVMEKNGVGHHLSAELQVSSPEFTKVLSGSQMTLIIQNVYDTPTRNFTWDFE